MADKNVFLIGMPATGKSTVGRLLGRLLGLPFYDSDDEIELRSGATVSWIFDVEGEAGFREREHQVLEELTQMKGVIVATGGGAVLRAANRQLLRSRGTVVLLDSSDRRIHARTAKDTKRPLLSGSDAAATIARLRRERLPLYRETADFTVVTDKQPARSVAKYIIRELGWESLSQEQVAAASTEISDTTGGEV